MDNKEERQSLRGFLAGLLPEELWEIPCKREDYLLSALVLELEKQNRFPAILLTDPDSGLRTAANLFADRVRLERAIHHITDVSEAAEQFSGFEIAEHAPVKECRQETPDLTSLPAFRHFEGDAGRYITSGIVMARDPESGRYNFSFHRMQLKGPQQLGISLHSRGDLWRYFDLAKKAGKDLEVAVVIGCHPAYSITGASKIPPSQDDYSWAGAYMDQTPLVVQADTVDLLVPAQAEYVLEGRILADESSPEGPFGEYTGFSTSRSTNNVLQIQRICHRKNPIWQDLVPGFAWEHLLLSQFTKEIILLHQLRREIPEVRDLCMPKDGCHFHAYLSMDPKAAGQAKQAMMLLFGLDLYLKLIITVNSDVNIHDEKDVLWAVATRVQADRDVFIVPGVLCNRLDPSSQDGVSAKMGIDATAKPGTPLSRVDVPESSRAQARSLLNAIQKEKHL